MLSYFQLDVDTGPVISNEMGEKWIMTVCWGGLLQIGCMSLPSKATETLAIWQVVWIKIAKKKYTELMADCLCSLCLLEVENHEMLTFSNSHRDSDWQSQYINISLYNIHVTAAKQATKSTARAANSHTSYTPIQCSAKQPASPVLPKKLDAPQEARWVKQRKWHLTN